MDHDVKNNATRPDISLLAVVAARDDFWSHIEGSTTLLGEILTFSQGFRGNAEVDESDNVLIGHHDVLWLDVAVNYILHVAVTDCPHQAPHILGGEAGALCELLG